MPKTFTVTNGDEALAAAAYFMVEGCKEFLVEINASAPEGEREEPLDLSPARLMDLIGMQIHEGDLNEQMYQACEKVLGIK